MGNNTSSSIRRTGSDPIAKADGKNSGFTVDPGPYEAVVQGFVQSSRLGQLMVTIPDFASLGAFGDQGISSDQITVSYASPFFGTTVGTDTGLNPNYPETAGQSYGMWFVPPDIGTTVLVFFAGGDLSKGYWFACAYNTPSHHMVPAISRHVGGSSSTSAIDSSDPVSGYIGSNSVLPVVEAEISDPALWGANGFATANRFPHEYQTMILVAQGLDTDPIRGAVSSSSMRESPSNVYGISTPGRRGTAAAQDSSDTQAVVFRTGGHSFVMDDGAAGDSVNTTGTDQLIRLRTTNGHQILMNDTENILYIASDSGNQWLEFGANGHIHMYGAAGFNLRSEGPINFHSDSAILMNATDIVMNASDALVATSDGEIAFSALAAFSVSAGGAASVTAGGTASLIGGAMATVSSLGWTNIQGTVVKLNCGLPGVPAAPIKPKLNTNTISSYNGKFWVADNTSIQSICTITPSHEPWTRPTQ